MQRIGSVILGTALSLGLSPLAWAHGQPGTSGEKDRQKSTSPEAQRRAPSETTVQEQWYTVAIAGQRAGWMRSTTTTTPTGISTEHEMSFKVKRESETVAITSRSTFMETHDAKPVSMRAVQSMGAGSTDTLFEFTPEGVRQTTITATGRQSTILPTIAGDWLTPHSTTRFVKEQIAAGTRSFSYRTISPTTGTAVSTETRTEASRSKAADGTTSIRFAATSTTAPGIEMFETFDSEGELLVQEVNSGEFPILISRTTKAQAMGTFQAPEILVSTYVIPDRPISGARSLKQAQYVLSVPEGVLPTLVGTGAQQTTRIDGRHARVSINATTVEPAQINPQERASALAATTLADSNDEKIRELVTNATKGLQNEPAARAEAMRVFVGSYIQQKNLSVGFASASETARSAVGDCTEHGVLLVAMLRADKIPARAVTGLVYADELSNGKGAFGFHMWAQALLTIDGQERWIDLDAAISRNHPFDATHIALATTVLADNDPVNGMLVVVPLLGRLKIEVVVPSTTPAQNSVPSKDIRHER